MASPALKRAVLDSLDWADLAIWKGRGRRRGRSRGRGRGRSRKKKRKKKKTKKNNKKKKRKKKQKKKTKTCVEHHGYQLVLVREPQQPCSHLSFKDGGEPGLQVPLVTPS